MLRSILIWIYRVNPSLCNGWMLRKIGISSAGNRRSFYTLDRILRSMPKVEGSIAECGVFQAEGLFGMANVLRQKNCKVRMFGMDSFEGFPEPAAQDLLANGKLHPTAEKGHFNDTSYEAVSRRCQALGFGDRITFYKGYFENTLHNLKNEKFSLVHLDCDLYQSYKECLNFFYDKVLPGGYIVFDEYSFSHDIYPGAQKAIDEFMADKPEKIQSFPEYEHTRYFIIKQ